MITIDRDYKNGHGERFTVKVSDTGFGGYKIVNITLEQAQIAVAHYYGIFHDKSKCPTCAKIDTGGKLRKGRRKSEVIL
jgi:hypothetical protein